MFSHTVVVALAALTSMCGASMPGLMPRQAFSGVATFNNYGAQGNTVCGPKSGASGTYAAAAGDMSPNISGGQCAGTMDDMSKCDGQSPVSGYVPPSCPRSNCGICYRVTNQGGYDGASVGGVGNTVVVQIVDSCPASSAQNYCKTQVPGHQRCAPGTDSLDIDQSAYQALTGQGFGNGVPNLRIGISPVSCSDSGSSNSQRSDSQSSNSQSSDSQRSDSQSSKQRKVVVSKPNGSKPNGSKPAGSKPNGSKSTNSKSTSSRRAGSKPTP